MLAKRNDGPVFHKQTLIKSTFYGEGGGMAVLDNLGVGIQLKVIVFKSRFQNRNYYISGITHGISTPNDAALICERKDYSY